ncbi:six-hairpin glycosidase-like protein [Aureisphaera galaxeae]|uniref:six-hairpin glycosidase-like protein n=1 Tax=Aureisphaera galaxeae TaxID=1538023 RepID=UPI00234FC2C3|nr:six-hairpin glycosidase-like protein [Aureisphaera galaxeae]MDC8003009.1 six-hairpin glycosidase-like protein [Aureisphaera galaxeae]
MKHLVFPLLLSISLTCIAQEKDYWEINADQSISWNLLEEDRLPHEENIEMSGKKVSAIIYYSINEDKEVSIKRDVIFPQLRTYNKFWEPDWKKYRAYFRRTLSDDHTPSINLDNKTLTPTKVDSISIQGHLRFYHTPMEGLQITRTLYPSMEDRFLVEEWTLTNTSNASLTLEISNVASSQKEKGYKGRYTVEVLSTAEKSVTLTPKQSYTFPVYYGATLNEESKEAFDYKKAKTERQDFLNKMADRLVLRTPDPVINQLFYFSKIRASESIFESSKMGLVHSPGGGNYYLGIWANDQVEYSGPFFPYLGYKNGTEAAYNTYKWFLKNIPEGDTHIPYAFEVDGNFPMTHLDRGDAAMIAYGTSHYALAAGNTETAKELWPLIEWSLEYCHNHRNKDGAVISESDEMEGRIETGTANLSTSSLYYGGLKYSIQLAESLGMNDKARAYKKRMKEMKSVINTYFASNIEGVDTYKYFEENKHLRHWICLPLCMDITERKEGTLDALFDKLWTENGILVELRPKEKDEVQMFWDRATLYALRGAFKVGATDRGFQKLKDYSKKRLLGDHVPYVIEAYPENNMKHLSAESALYCRIFTEGMLGMEPVDFSKLKLKPSLPAHWDYLDLKDIQLFGKNTDISIQRKQDKLELEVVCNGKSVYNGTLKNNEAVLVDLGS